MIGKPGRQSLDRDGAVLLPAVMAERELDKICQFADGFGSRPGGRIFDPPEFLGMLLKTGPLDAIACELLGSGARPVRILMFNKNPAANWAVAWHQDRTIAVNERRPRPGFETWTTKSGVPHVEPPFEYIQSMVSLRLHLDDCGPENGPLKVIPGSHRLGKLSDLEIREISSREQPQIFCAERGDVLVLRTNIVHASERAANPVKRRVLHIDFSARNLPEGLDWRIRQLDKVV